MHAKIGQFLFSLYAFRQIFFCAFLATFARTNVRKSFNLKLVFTMEHRFYPLRVTGIVRETPDCVSLEFEVPADLQAVFSYLPGQYLTLRRELEGEEVRRSYSLCSAPYEGRWRVAVKQVPGGRFSTYANRELPSIWQQQGGLSLEVMPPKGDFVLKPEPSRAAQHVFFAAGSGITPVMAMLKEGLQREPHSSFVLFYGNRSTEQIIFREELAALKNRYPERFALHYILSGEHPGSELFYGRIDREKCRVFFRHLLNPREVEGFYLCGPLGMIEEVEAALQEFSVPSGKWHKELFTPAGSGQKQSAATVEEEKGVEHAQIEVIIDDDLFRFEWDGSADNIVDAGIENNIDIPYSCKGGVCSTCKAKVLEGKVQMRINYALEPDQVEAGYVLSCQCVPLTEKVVLSYDD